MAERGGFEPPVRFKPVRRFSKPFLSATQASLRNCCQTVECQNSIIRNLSPFSENASQKLQIIRKKSQIPRFFSEKQPFPSGSQAKKTITDCISETGDQRSSSQEAKESGSKQKVITRKNDGRTDSRYFGSVALQHFR